MNNTSNIPSDYPPDNLSEAHFHAITTQIKDYQTNHGSLIKVIGQETEHSVLLQPVGTSVFPTLFPRRLFDQAIRDLQPVYNELYCKLAEDEEWLYAVTGQLRKTEPLVDALWSVYEEVQRRRQRNKQYVEQKVHAGIFRSDYMLHTTQSDDEDEEDEDWTLSASLKQVEFNSYSCAGGCHANKVANMHRYLAQRGVYDFSASQRSQYDSPVRAEEEEEEEDNDDQQGTMVTPSSLPKNNTINGIASLLASAHKTYGKLRCSSTASCTAVLIIVQPNNFNIADERPIEYALWNWKLDNGDDDDPIPTYRVEWQDIPRYTVLAKTGELLFYPPENEGKKIKPVEISVVYHRAGYEPHEYTPEGTETRINLELSHAIKCPSILGHITTIKTVQQALTNPGVLERWLLAHKADMIRQTFVNIYPLDNTSPRGVEGRRIAMSLTTITRTRDMNNYILKPASLEGGGHNIYGSDIPDFLRSPPLSSDDSPLWSAYVLMERIRPPQNVYSVIMTSSRGFVADEVVSELGVFGGCLWKRTSHHQEYDGNEGEETSSCQMVENRVVGWSFKTKEASLDEMSVVKGYGCFDTPFLID